MKCLCKKSVVALLALTLTVSAARMASANELANPGFEDPVTMDGAPFVGFWEAFTSGAPLSQNSSTMPRNGAQHLELFINNAANQFAGAFQDVAGLSAGQLVTFSGWHKLVSGASGGTEVRIEWRNEAGNNEVARTPNMVAIPGADYTEFSLAAAVPAGADLARVVYAIQSFGGVLTQQVFLDDMSVVAIPEPASFALIGVAAVALLGVRRRIG